MTENLPAIDGENLKNADFPSLSGQIFTVEKQGMALPCRLQTLPNAKRLFIMLNGAVDRTKTPLPVFARWNWGPVLAGHVLSVCDPTLYLDERLRLGWFLGRVGHDPLELLLAVVDEVASQLGQKPENVIFYGSSGGGYAALVAASKRKIGRAIAINPQTEILGYRHQHLIKRVAEVFAPGVSAEASRSAHPLRWSALESVAEARRNGRDLRFFYAQNSVDDFHHDHHYLPFCERFDLPPRGGSNPDGTAISYIYDSPEGHNAEPPAVVKHITAVALPFLLNGT